MHAFNQGNVKVWLYGWIAERGHSKTYNSNFNYWKQLEMLTISFSLWKRHFMHNLITYLSLRKYVAKLACIKLEQSQRTVNGCVSK